MVLRVRNSRRPSEPAPVSTGEGSHRCGVILRIALVAAALLAATSCSLVGGDDDSGDDGARRGRAGHPRVVRDARGAVRSSSRRSRGYDLVVRASGDAGALTNKLVLTKDDPTGDAVFGIDNTFGSRAIDEGVLAPYAATLPAGADEYALEGDDDHDLTPVDTGNVCVNVDDTWFADHGVARPATLDDLPKPAYKDLFVTPGATTSSPGLAFLLATIAAYGDGWQDYWSRADGQRRQAHPGLVGRLRGRLHPGRRGRRPADRAVLRLLAGVHHRRPGRHHDQCAARHLLPPGRVRRRAGRRGRTRRAPRRWSTSCSAGRSRRRCPTRCTSSRSTPASPLPPDWAKFAPAARARPTPSTRPRSPSTATSG